MGYIDHKKFIKYMLKSEIMNISFTKKDGTIRHMKCTLCPNLIPQKEKELNEEHKERKQNEDILSVYDIENNDWRSFRWESLISYEIHV